VAKNGNVVASEPVLVSVGADLRKVFPWFEDGSKAAKDAALKKKKEQLRAKGPSLNDDKLRKAWKAKRKIDARIKTLQRRQQVIKDALDGHYGHMSEDTWVVGNETVGWPSFRTSFDQSPIEASLGETSWKRITRRYVEVPLFLALITAQRYSDMRDKKKRKMTTASLRKLVLDSVVPEPSVSIAAPSEEAEQLYLEKKAA